MKKFEIKKSFKSNKFRYGGYATLLTAVVLVILIVINLLADQANFKFDMTKNKLYSLSDQSYKVMDTLKQPINIISFYKAGNENVSIKEILGKYAKGSKQITLKSVDPVVNPQIASKYTKDNVAVTEGSIVVESGNKYKVISSSDLVNTTMDQNTGQQSVQSLAVEQRVTGALMYVVNAKDSVVYRLQGHNEQPLASEVTQALTTQNFQIKDLNLLTGDWKAQDNDMLLISSPSTDLSSTELTKLKDYFAKGGHAVFMMDLTKNDLPNFKALINTFGVNIDRAVVLEGDSNHMVQNPLYLVPDLGNQDIVKPLSASNIPVLIPAAQPIEKMKVKKDSIKIESLLTSTSKSWGKVNLTSQTSEKEAGDLNGPFDVAVAITDTMDASKPDVNTKVVIFSSSQFLSSQIISNVGGGNIDLFMNSMNWVQNLKDNISITPKDLTSQGLKITDGQKLAYSGLVVFFIPGIVFIAGIVMWLRRRHK